MVDKKIFKSKILAYLLIYSFFLMITSEAIPYEVNFDTSKEFKPVVRVKEEKEQIPAARKDRFKKLIEEGKKLFQEEMDYEGAIKTYKEAQALAVTRAQKADVFFYLSLVYYADAADKGTEEFEQAIKKLIELDYRRKLDKDVCPTKYIELFQEIKKEYGALNIQSKPAGADVYLNDNRVPAGKTPLLIVSKAGSVRIKVKKGKKEKKAILRVIAGRETRPPVIVLKGGSSFLLIIGGLVLAAGGAAALGGGGGGGNGGGPEPYVSPYGSILVNSSPQGARVYLNGVNTGRTTNTTLTDVSPGSHTVKLVKDGYQDRQESVSVLSGQTAVINAPLTKITITIPNITSGTIWTSGKQVEIKWTTNASASSQGNFSSGAGLNSGLHPRRNLLSSLRRRALRQRYSFRNLMNRRGEQKSTGLANAGEIISNKSNNFQDVSTKFSSSNKEGRNSLQRTKDIGINKKNNIAGSINFPIAPGISPQSLSPSGGLKALGLANVKIQLYKGTTLKKTITSSTTNDGSYMWTVDSSLAGGTDYKVRISCVTDLDVYVESAQFKIEPSITVTKPTSSTIWTKGQSADITWTSKDTINSVKIRLYKGTTLKYTISSITTNDGSYTWSTVLTSLADGTDYKVRISNYSNSNEYGESAQFRIKSEGTAGITVTKPTSSTVWYKGDSAAITWTSTGVGSYVKIQLYKGTTLKKTISSMTSNDGSYTWSTVSTSFADGTDYKVKISDYYTPTTYGESAQFKIAPPSITVTKPISSTVWYKGQSADITWTSAGAGSNVKIYLYKGTTQVRTIDSYDSNDGSYTWSTVSTTLADGTDYKVRITDYYNSSTYGESASFKIGVAPPGITVTTPTSSTEWSKGTSASIYWTSKDAGSYVKIDLYKGTTLKKTIITSTANDGYYTWSSVDTSLADGTDYKVRITSTTTSTLYGESAQFKIGPPSITVTAPASSTVWTKSQSAAITWTSTGTSSYVKIQLYKATTLVKTIDSFEYNDGSYTWSKVDASLTDGTDYKLKISDYYTSSIYGESAQFKIDSPITVTKPISSTVWSKDQSADITWTSKVTITNVKIQLYKGTTLKKTITSTTPNDGSFTWSKVDLSLADGTDYKVRITSTIDSNLYGESAQFKIESPIVVTKPTSSTVWKGNEKADITWTSKGTIANVKIDLYKGTTFQTTIISSTANDGSYNLWTVNPSLTDGTDYKVKITSTSNPSIYGESPYFTIGEPGVTVTAPISSTVWYKGSSATITWTTKGIINYVKIELYKGTTRVKTIDSSEYNDGSYSWYSVSTTLADGTDYKVKITSTIDTSLYGESANFEISSGSITVTKPTSSTVWYKGSSPSINWTSKGAISYVKIDLYKGTIFQQTIDSSVYDDGSYTWSTVPTSLTNGTDYKVRITWTINSGIFGESANFEISTGSLTVTKPTSSTVWYKGQSGDITWTSTGAGSYVKIELYKGTILKKTITSSATNDGSHTWSTVDSSLADGTDYKVKITSTSNSSVYDESAQFKIEPSITITAPTTGTVWTKGQSATITWTSKGTINYVQIQLYKGTAYWHLIDPYEYNDGSYTWSTVYSGLADGSDYKVRITDVNNSIVVGYSDVFQIKSGSAISTKNPR